MLRLRNLGNLGLGNPGTMNITVVDDDGKLRNKEWVSNWDYVL